MNFCCPRNLLWFILCVLFLFVDTPVHSQEASSSAAVVFVTSYLERGDASTTPRPEQISDAISIFAAPGEYEPATFSIRALQEFKTVQVELAGDLEGQKGAKIPKAAVEIRLVDPFESWSKIKYEQFLLKKNRVDIPTGITRRFWLTIHVPENTKPGIYSTKIAITAPVTEVGPDLGRLMTLKNLTYEVEVLPIKLLPARDTGMVFFMYHNTGYFPAELVTEEYQKRVFEDMREHGLTTATVYLYPVVDGTFTLTGRQEKHLGFSPTMNLLEETGLIAPGLPVIWLGAESYGEEVWKTILEEGKKQNWPELIFYAVDEPGTEERNRQVRAFMQKFNAFRRKYPECKVRVTTALGSSRGIQTVGHYYDLWIACMAQETGESAVIADARMQKKELWIYDCMLAPVAAETNRYYFGVWAWISGVKGCSHWAYFDGAPSLSYVYPSQDEIIPTIGWEAIREGIDDYRYLTTLKKIMEQARSLGKEDIIKDAEKIFTEVTTMVTMDNYGAAYHKAMRSGVDTAYQRPRVEPDLPIQQYDKLRLKIAREIEKISRVIRTDLTKKE